jgi:hypothetical protein
VSQWEVCFTSNEASLLTSDAARPVCRCYVCDGPRRLYAGATVSHLHANFFVNARRQAAPDDFLQLIALARDAVWKHASVLLELEVKIIKHGRVLTVEDL